MKRILVPAVPVVLPAVSLAILCAVCVLISRHIGVLCDDAFIGFVYAKNWAVLHRGLTYNGAIVQGYTNPLWTLTLAGLGRIGCDIPTAAIWLGRLSACGLICATYWLGRVVIHPQITQTTQIPGRDQSVKSVDIWLPLLPAAFVAFSFDVAIYTASGLETVLFAALFTAAVAALLLVGRGNPAPPSGWHGYASPTVILPAVLCGLLALTRPEGLAVILAATLFLAWSAYVGAHGHAPAGMGGRPSAPTMISAALFLGISTLIALPWFLWAHSFYGDWLPNTFYAKAGAFSIWNLRHGWHYLFPATASGILTGALVVALVVIAVRHSRVRPLAVAALAWLVYAFVIGGDFMPGLRLTVPILPAAIVAALATTPTGGRRWVIPTVAVVALVVFVGVRRTDARTLAHLEGWHTAYRVRYETGCWLRANLPPRSLIAVCGAGEIPYYCELPTIDMLGLNDKHIARHGRRDPSLLVGHQMGDGDYVLARRPTVMFAGPAGPGPNGLWFVSDRMMHGDPRIATWYRARLVALPSGSTVFLQRLSHPTTD